ncbi:MAG TPA: hypothetical protein GX727_00430 [Clostridium sp.]|nr:hypothetical protein [Clostridium sp.]
MAQFCTCGSLIVDDKCTNKNCKNILSTKSSSSTKKRVAAKKTATEEKPKTTRTRRASKCITYNLYDKKEESSI